MISVLKKIIPFILILLILIPGIFGSATPVDAAGTCWDPNNQKPVVLDEASCIESGFEWTTVTNGQVTTTQPPKGPEEGSALADNLPACLSLLRGTLEGCLVKLFYFIFVGITSFLLNLSASFFDIMVALALSSKLYTASTFIPEAWAVVRDLSNIFFILILLYIAIKTILGLGGHDSKKMIATVLIMALLINFSMFFTKVVIDSSNILALIFYNKIDVETTVNGQKRDYLSTLDASKTGIEDKGISGGLASAFNPTKLLTQDFFDQLKERSVVGGLGLLGTAGAIGTGALIGSVVPIFGTVIGAGVGFLASQTVGYFIPQNKVPTTLLLSIIVISGLIMGFAAYAFFVAGLSFIGRLVELWILIIFSPFAFMSLSLPLLGKVPGVGWEEWLKKLFQMSFMAPIFMFFIYLIFKLVKADMFNQLAQRTQQSQQSTMETIILMVIPALVILILLMKATSYAKKGGGLLGEKIIGGGKAMLGLAAGVAGGAALGTLAVAGRGTIGRAGHAAANSQWAKKWESSVFGGEAVMAGLKKVGGGSFDVRRTAAGAGLAKASGVDFEAAKMIGLGSKEGGFTKRREEDVKKRQERAKQVEVGEDEELKQRLNHSETDLQKMLDQVTKDFEDIDRDLVSARQKKADAQSGSPEEADAIRDINALRARRTAIEDGSLGPTVTSGVNAGKSIEEMKKQVIPDAKSAIHHENVRRRGEYADKLEGGWNKALNFVLSGGQYSWRRGANEAAHQVRMGVKIDSGTKT